LNTSESDVYVIRCSSLVNGHVYFYYQIIIIISYLVTAKWM